ncbi:MAG: S26 family signal peptidase [Rhodobacteraceae bacterium]|nr:S26 family signal peptidase [Paracoccaceae bacterium]
MLIGTALVLGLLICLFGLTGGRINLSPSIDGLLFRALPPEAVAVGDLVTFCLPFPIETHPEMARASVRLCAMDQFGHPLLKRVIRIQANGALWVEGEREGSLDSRVFGAVPQVAVLERVRRIW